MLAGKSITTVIPEFKIVCTWLFNKGFIRIEYLIYESKLTISSGYRADNHSSSDSKIAPIFSDISLDFVINEVLPRVAEEKLAQFCDIFCEKDVFSIAQSRRLLTAAKKLGLKIKLHADEIVQTGGAELAADLKAVSADHLLQASDEGIRKMARAGVVATLLPATAFSLKEPYARGRYIIDNNGAVALATDYNPGSCFTESIPLIFSLATLYMGLTTEEAVSALTINAAAALDKADSIGSIDPGKQADLVVFSDIKKPVIEPVFQFIYQQPSGGPLLNI